MKLEFLDDISDGGRFRQVVSDGLVRLYEFDRNQATRLRDRIVTEILEGSRALDLSSVDFIEGVNCALVFTISEEDEGLKTKDKVHFECALTIASYLRMVQLMQGFCERESDGYQWLYELDCEIDLLFSPGGTW
jgi:hypothetical protein